VETFINTLIASGPMAVVLGLGLVVLWRKLQAQRIYYEGDPDPDKSEKTPGKLATMASDAQTREDLIRKDYDGRLSKQRVHYEGLITTQRGEYEGQLRGEREENKGLFREINETIRALGAD